MIFFKRGDFLKETNCFRNNLFIWGRRSRSIKQGELWETFSPSVPNRFSEWL